MKSSACGENPMTQKLKLLTLLFASLGLFGCGPNYEIITTCTDKGDIHPICGLKNPEDLYLLDDDNTVIVSQFGSLTQQQSGSLALLKLDSEQFQVVYPKTTSTLTSTLTPTNSDNGEFWGAGCPSEPGANINPHGIDYDPESGRLLVINHGGRESIEMFQVIKTQNGDYDLQWRGCVVAPPGAFLNDVAHLPSGGFVATHMFDPQSAAWENLIAAFGVNTGWVYQWQPESGFTQLPGTEVPFANGITVSEDGKIIYLNAYAIGEVRKIERESGKLLATAQISNPDNIAWSKDRKLLVASHRGSVADLLQCGDLASGACPLPFAITEIEPETFAYRDIFENAAEPMGAGTVALDLGNDNLLIGAFAGDRVIRVKLAKP